MKLSPDEALEASTYDDLSRLRDGCDRDEETGCLRWRGAVRGGYSRISVQGTTVDGHRLAATWWWGPVDEYDVHHTCGNRRCVERAHLLPLTAGDHHRAHATGRLLAA